MFDLIVRGGTVYDGTGSKARVTDIGVNGDKITAIDDLREAKGRDEIDARGLCVLPGFIDTHTHSDMVLLFDRQHASGLYQGITTELIGQDGLSYAPLSKDNLSMYTKYLRGLNGEFEDIGLDFTGVDGFLKKFHKKTAINVAYQVPHGAIRLEALGFNDIPLKGYAMDKAKNLMRQGFKDGAVAFSTGLSYFPCSYADTAEMVELCEVCAEYDVPFVIHTRSVFRGEPFDHVAEAIEIARRSGCRLHFSHFRTGKTTAGQVEKVLEPIEKAMAEGVRITLETYPYYAGSGYAVIFLPPWAVEGGYEATLERLADASLRPRIAKGINENTFPPEGAFTHLIRNAEYIGRDFESVAKDRGQTVAEMLCDILLEENLEVGYSAAYPTDAETCGKLDKDFIQLLSKPYYMICSDSIHIGKKPHPRTTSTFPRFLRLAREQGMALETFANRASAVPAKTFGLKGRGLISEGYFADLVVLDAQRVKETATYPNPRRAPDGIAHVTVNGEIAVYDGRVTGLLNGYALKK